MNDTPETTSSFSGPPMALHPPGPSVQLRHFYVALAVLVAGYGVPLYHLIRFAFQSELFSHVLLIPFVSIYLIWTKRHTLSPHLRADPRLALIPVVAGLALLIVNLVSDPDPEDGLALTILSFVLLVLGICLWFHSAANLRRIAFPLGFLFFMAPFPGAMTEWIETQLQHTSASAAYRLFQLGGTTVFRQDTFFQLPGMKLLVAPECSGIHSTLALFITSLVAGYLFLESGWKRALLAAAVIPLAILRNGFRVFVIGELCVHIGPEMIDSYIHRHGGPIFFALALVPFVFVLWLLIKSERKPLPPHSVHS